MNLFRDDVGAYLALGGNRSLASAAEALEEVRERRQAGEPEVRDPVAAEIVRAQGPPAPSAPSRSGSGRCGAGSS